MMRAQTAKSASDHRFEQAAQWYLKLRGDLSNEELLEWEQWYADPENQEALELVRSVSPIHGRLRRPELLSAERVQADEYDGSESVSDWVEKTMAADGEKRRSRIFSVRGAGFLALAAGVCGIVAVAAVFVSGGWWSGSVEPLQVYRTEAGQHQDVTLSDGSRITLGARTRISTNYSAARRIVFLEEGEALFRVAKNKARPFTVVAAGGTVTAVGTQFNVRTELNRVTVTVTEGAVDVAPSDAGNPPPVTNIYPPALVPAPAAAVEHRPHWQPTRLVKGQEVTYEDTQGRGSVIAAEPGATEWLSGRLQYRHVPLKYVAADVQRYFNKAIVLSDQAAGEYEFTGTIYQAEVGDWFRALEKIFPLDVSQADEHVIIRSRLNTAAQRPTTPQ